MVRIDSSTWRSRRRTWFGCARPYPYAVRHSRAQVAELIGRWDEALAGYDANAAAARQAGDAGAIAESLSAQGSLLVRRSEHPQGSDLLAEARRLFEQLGDWPGLAAVLGALGHSHRDQGRYADAVELYRRQIRLSAAAGDTAQVGRASGYVGSVYFQQGKLNRALACYRNKLAIAERLDAVADIAAAANSIGGVLVYLGEFDQALVHLQRANDLSMAIGNAPNAMLALGNMAAIHGQRRQNSRALEMFRRQQGIARRIGDRRVACQSVCNIAEAHFQGGDHRVALDGYREGYTLAYAMANKAAQGLALLGMGRCAFELGDDQLAGEHYQRCLELAGELEDQRLEAQVHAELGLVSECRCDWPAAVRHWENAANLSRAMDLKLMLGGYLYGLAAARFRGGSKEGVMSLVDEVEQLCQTVGDDDVGFQCRLLRARLIAPADQQRALALADQAIAEAAGVSQRISALETRYRLTGSAADGDRLAAQLRLSAADGARRDHARLLKEMEDRSISGRR